MCRGHRQLSTSPPNTPTPWCGAYTSRTSRISSFSISKNCAPSKYEATSHAVVGSLASQADCTSITRAEIAAERWASSAIDSVPASTLSVTSVIDWVT